MEKKCFTEFVHPFMVKTVKKEENYLNIIMAIYEKTIACITLNNIKQKVLPLRSKTRQGCPLSPFLFNRVMKILDKIILI